MAFVIASTIYRWVVTYGIVLFLYTVLKPYRLQSVGIALAVASVGTMFYQMGHSVYQVLKMPRDEPIDRRQRTLTLFVATAVVAGVFLIPVPWYIEAPLTLQPAGVQHIYPLVPGELLGAHVREGDRVTAGAPVATLRNIDLEARVREMASNRDVQAPEIALHRQLGHRDEALLATRRQASLAELAAAASLETEKLSVTAPIGGTIIAPARQPRPKLSQTETRLGTWFGTPLDPGNQGAWLSERTHLCSIAPGDEFEAVLLIDQADRGEIEGGGTVRLMIESLPDLVLTGRVETVADRPVEFAPPALSSKHGGTLATTTDSAGRERLGSLAYQATVPIEGIDPARLRSGMRGSARVLITRRTLAEGRWRGIRHTFRCRL